MAIWYKQIHLSAFNRIVLKDHPPVVRLLNVIQVPNSGHPYDARVYFVVDTESPDLPTQVLEIQSLPTSSGSDVQEAQDQFLGTVVMQVGTMNYVWHHFGKVIQ